MNIKKDLILLLKGGAIGVANIIPGVSGGTLAVVLGIYDRLIASIANFFTVTAKRKEYLFFLIKVFGGAAIAIVLLANLMDFLLTEHVYKTMFLFMGLILGGIPAVINSHGDMKIRPRRVFAFILGMVIVLGISIAGAGHGESGSSAIVDVGSFSTSDYILLLVSGFLAGGAMIVPGVSGSFLLVLLGQYAVIISAIKNMAVKPLGVVAIGAASGILVFSKIIEICLEKMPARTYYFILGLIFASFYKIFPGIPAGGVNIAFCLIAFAAGASVSYLLSKVSGE